MDTKIFKLLLQSIHLGANRATAIEQLLVIPPHTTERDVAFEPHDCFVIILQDRQVVKRRCTVYSASLQLPNIPSCSGDPFSELHLCFSTIHLALCLLTPLKALSAIKRILHAPLLNMKSWDKGLDNYRHKHFSYSFLIEPFNFAFLEYFLNHHSAWYYALCTKGAYMGFMKLTIFEFS